MAYLRNNTVNRLNLHYGIHAFALDGGGVFLRVFLLKAGLSAPAVLLVIAAIVAARFALRPLVLAAAKRFGLKALPIKLLVPPLPVGAVTLKNRTLSPLAQLFLKGAREVAKPLANTKT